MRDKENNVDCVCKEEDYDKVKKRWTIRRRIALTAFIQINVLTLFFLVVPIFVSGDTAEVMSQFNPIIISLISLFSAIVMVYMGAASWDDVRNRDVLNRNR